MDLLGKKRRLKLRDGLSISEIVRHTDLSRNTVKSWLKAGKGTVPKYRRHGRRRCSRRTRIGCCNGWRRTPGGRSVIAGRRHERGTIQTTQRRFTRTSPNSASTTMSSWTRLTSRPTLRAGPRIDSWPLPSAVRTMPPRLVLTSATQRANVRISVVYSFGDSHA